MTMRALGEFSVQTAQARREIWQMLRRGGLDADEAREHLLAIEDAARQGRPVLVVADVQQDAVGVRPRAA